MKGKKLIQLFNTLSKSNKHVLLNKCKTSNDKRQKEIYNLLINYQGNNKKFQKILDSIGSNLTTSNNVNKDKATRRFVDFAVNLTEDIIIQEHINKDGALRNSILSKIFKDKNNLDLQKLYLRKLYNQKLETLDDNIQQQYYDDSISLAYLSYKDQNIEKWWELVGNKYDLSNKIYLNNISRIHELASASYLVDKKYGEAFLDKMMEHKHLNLIKDVVKGSVKAVEIKLAEARFNFENKEKAFALMDEIRTGVTSLTLSEVEQIDLDRKINFISFLLAYNYNNPLNEIKSYNEKLLAISTKFNRPDSLNNFYRLFLSTIENPLIDINAEIEKVRINFEIHDDTFLLDFLILFHSFINKDYKTALFLVNDLSYAPNLYVKIWSKQIELLIHYKKGNFDLCETLTDRILRQMKQMKSMPYTLASSAKFLIEVHRILGSKEPKLYKELASNFVSHSILHNTLIKHLKNTN